MPPRPAVDSRPAGYVADAEFGGELPVGHAVCPACPQLPDLVVGQLGPGMALAGRAVIRTVALPASWLESGLDVITAGIDRRPVLGRPAAVSTGVAAGRPASFADPVVPPRIGRV